MALLKRCSLFLLGDVVSLLELVHVQKIHLGGCMTSIKLLVSLEDVRKQFGLFKFIACKLR